MAAETAEEAPPEIAEPIDLSLEQLREAWTRSVLPALRERSIPVATLLDGAVVESLEADTVTLAFLPASGFHRAQVDDQKNLVLIREALFEVTGRRLAVTTVESDAPERSRPGRRPAERGPGHLAAQGHAQCNGSRGARMKLDMNALMKQAQQMQEQMAKAQEEAQNEIAEASAGGGMVTARANGAGQLLSISIDPRAADPDDVEMLADMVVAATNEAIRSAQQAVEAKLRGQMPDLGALGLPGLVAEPRSAQ